MSACAVAATSAAETDDSTIWKKVPIPAQVAAFEGYANLFGAPAMQRLFAQKFPNAETHVVREAGHATYWEQPEEFNRVVLDWIGRHNR